MKTKWILSALILTLFLTGCKASSKPMLKKQGNRVKEEILSQDNEMQIVVISEDHNMIFFQLNDSVAAKSLYAQLPLSTTVENYSNNEKIFYPPEKLDVQNTPHANGKAGTLAYYEPWKDVVMFYDDFEVAEGLYVLGEVITATEEIDELNGTIKIVKRKDVSMQQEKRLESEE